MLSLSYEVKSYAKNLINVERKEEGSHVAQKKVKYEGEKSKR